MNIDARAVYATPARGREGGDYMTSATNSDRFTDDEWARNKAGTLKKIRKLKRLQQRRIAAALKRDTDTNEG